MATYTESELDLIFRKGWPVRGYPGYVYDCDSRIIGRHEYGKRTTYGWEVDHQVPASLGGPSVYGNLRPRHWLGNSYSGGLLGGLLSGQR